MLLHVFGHIDAYHRPVIVKEKFGKSARRLGFSDAGRTQEHEHPDRPVAVLQARAGTPDGIRNALQCGILADDSSAQQLFHPDQLLDLALQHLGHGNAGPFRDNLCNVLFVDLFFQHPLVLLNLVQTSVRIFQPAFQLLDLSITDFRHPRVIALTLGLLLFHARLLNLLLQGADRLNQFLLALPPQLHLGGFFAKLAQFLFDQRQPLAGRRVVFLAQRLALDLQLNDLALHRLQIRRQRIDLHAQARRSFIDQVDRLVGQKTVGDVAMRQHRRGKDRGIFDLHAVVNFIAFLEAAQNGDRVLDGRLSDIGLLKPPLERFVFLDVLLVFVQRRCADASQITARQRGFQHVGGIDRPFGAAGADQRVKLVDKQDDVGRFLNFLENRFQTIFELAAIFRTRNHRAQIQRHDPLALQRLGNITRNDASRQTLDDCGLSNARLADQDGIVFGAARQNLHHAPDLLVTPDHRIELALASQIRQVARIALERLIFFLRIRVCDLLRAADGNQDLQDRVLGETVRLQEPPGGLVFGIAQRNQKVLGADVFVFEPVCFLLRILQNPAQRGTHVNLGLTRNRRQLGDRIGQIAGDGLKVHAQLLKNRQHHAVLLLDHRPEQMLRRHLRMPLL